MPLTSPSTKRFLRGALAAALSIIAFACAAIAPPLPGGVLGDVARPRSYRGEVRVRVSGEEGGGSFTAIVLASPPRRAELIVVDAMGRELAEYGISPSGIVLRRAAGDGFGIDDDLLPSPGWYAVAFTLLGGRLPGEPAEPPTPVRGGYRAVYRLDRLTLEARLDEDLRLRAVVGDDGTEVTLGEGKGGFPSLVVRRGELTRIEIVPLSLERCDDPFSMEIP